MCDEIVVADVKDAGCVKSGTVGLNRDGKNVVFVAGACQADAQVGVYPLRIRESGVQSVLGLLA